MALHEPRALILADQAETPLYYLDMELREAHPDVRIVPRIMDVAEPAMVELLFEEYRPDRVFHAAAYKHVPLMESHVTQAVRNNVVGTWRVAEAVGATAPSGSCW